MSDKRILSPDSQQRVLFDRMMLGICTAIPGSIIAFDSSTCLATVRPSIQMKMVAPTDNGTLSVTYLDLPDIECVPVCLPHSVSGGLFITVPIKAGDDCLLVFSQRDISNFVQFGSNKPPPSGGDPKTSAVRHHDMTDAICIPGLFNIPRRILGWSDSAIEIRSFHNDNKVKVSNDGIEVFSVNSLVSVTSESTKIQMVSYEGGSKSVINITMFGTAGTSIPKNSVISDELGFYSFLTDDDYTIGGDGTVEGSATSAILGSVNPPKNNIIKIVSTKSGWNYVTNTSTSSVGSNPEINYSDGNSIEVSNSSINMTTSGASVEMTGGNINMSGTVMVTGSVSVTGEVTATGIPLSTHLHTGVTSGAQNTGTPTV